jgi:hypothetical protein
LTLVIDVDRVRGMRGRSLLLKVVSARLPSSGQVDGPVSGRWGQLNLLGERHWVKRRFHAEITAADADVGFTYQP